MTTRAPEPPVAADPVTVGSAAGRWVLLASILGSGLAGIDATVVNVALPAIGADLDADFAALQWTVSAYTLTLASFILLGGALGDRFGRRWVFLINVPLAVVAVVWPNGTCPRPATPARSAAAFGPAC